jgi:dsRNA-specific ribonuclease
MSFESNIASIFQDQDLKEIFSFVLQKDIASIFQDQDLKEIFQRNVLNTKRSFS